MKNSLPHDRILPQNLYNGDPWNVLSDNAPWVIVKDSGGGVLKKEIYVFTELKRTKRGQIVREAGCGTWTGKIRAKEIENCNGQVIGFKNHFSFKVKGNSKQDKEKKQDQINKKHGRWIMHEYTLPGSSGDIAICRISWDRPKCCVNSEAAVSLATELIAEASHCSEEMTRNQALPDQEPNSEDDFSWVYDMPDDQLSELDYFSRNLFN